MHCILDKVEDSDSVADGRVQMGTVWAEQQVALAVHCPQQIVELEIRLHGCKSSPLVHLPTQEIDLQYCSNRKVGYRLCSRRQKILTSFRFWNFSARPVNSFSSAPVSVWLGKDPRGSLGGFSAGKVGKGERAIHSICPRYFVLQVLRARLLWLLSWKFDSQIPLKARAPRPHLP